MRSCVIIPAFNESKEIAALVKAIKAKVPDILVVDDGSTDSTSQIAERAGAAVLKNSVNAGKGVCIRRGFRYALENNFDAVITMDGDGQHLPEDLPVFLRLGLDPQSDIVAGNRMGKTQNMPFIRVITNRFMSWLISILSKQKIPDTQCGYRLIKRRVLERIALTTDNFEIESEILIKASRMGFKIASVPIKTIYRGEKSQINPLLDTLRFIKFIIKISS